MNEKNENIIKAKYYTKKGIIKEGKFNSYSTFGQILDYFKKNNKNKFFKLKPKYIFNGEIVKNNQLISKLIHIDKNCSLKSAEIWIEINNESSDKKGEQDIIQKKILKPIKNPFSILVITPLKNSISLEKYPEYLTKKFDLYDFNYSSAYCDSPNFLFISGGDQQSKILDKFWIIEHELYSIEQKKMPYPKKNHSMIYIDEGLVYIVGGNTNITFFYDLEKDEFTNCGNLIQVYQEPTLIRINDYIYCLNSLKDKNFFERIKITRMSGNWEKINVFISQENKIEFTNNFFGALNIGNGNIIICGGNNISENSFTFNYFSHILIKNEEKDENIELGDKRLYQINNNNYIGISKYFEENKEIIILNKKIKQIKKIKCNTKEIIDEHFNDIKKYEENDNDKEEDLSGAVSVNAIINRNDCKGVFTIKNLGPNLEDKFDDFLKEQKDFVENNLRTNKNEINDKEISNKVNSEISSKKKIDDLSDNLGFLEVKIINPINDKNIKDKDSEKSDKNYRNIFIKETNLKIGERYDKDDDDEDEDEEEEEEEKYFCNNFQYNISEKFSELKKSGTDKEFLNYKLNKKKNEEKIFDKINRDNIEQDKLNNKQYNNILEKSIENIKEIVQEKNIRIIEINKEKKSGGNKGENSGINKEENIEKGKKDNERNKEENFGKNKQEYNNEKNKQKNNQEYNNNPINNNNSDEKQKNDKNSLLELKKEVSDNENNIDKQKEYENEKKHKEKYDNLRKNILDFQSTSDIYALSQNHLSEISPEKENTISQNKQSSEPKNQKANNNSPSIVKQLNDSSDISDFKYYQNRLEHFEKKFNINFKNEKCQNKIDASNKITNQNLNSVFTPVVNNTRYPKIESSSPYCSLRLTEQGFIVNPTNSEENPNPMYNSLKESNINDGYATIYEKILKKQEDGINLPVIDSSKIYQFQK